jgi:hypothetical protein
MFRVSPSANGDSQRMANRRSIRIHLLRGAGLVLVLLAQPAVAGPPFVSDDPEPTPYKQFEIYTFNNGTNSRDGTGGEAGIDFNYGAAPDLQLTATLPAGYDRPIGGGTNIGMSNVELAAKFRLLHQDIFGLDLAVFPRVFLPSGSNRIGDNHVSLLLPVWVEKDWNGGWSAFGGGGCVVNEIRSADFCEAGAVLTYQVLPRLQIGAEIFHQTATSGGTPEASSVGVGWRYDLDKNFHLLGYVRRGVQNTDETDRYSWYSSILFTF